MLACCAVLLLPVLGYRMGVDQGVFAYIGSGILQGRWPYLSSWDHAFPGIMFLHAAEILIFGKSIAMFRLFDFLFQLCNIFLIHRIAYKLCGRSCATIAAATFALIYQGYGAWNTAQREGFGLLFVLAGFWLYLTSERRPIWKSSLGIGLGLGIAFLIKPTLLACVLFYAPLARHLNQQRVGRLLVAVGGFLLPIIPVICLYEALGGWRDLYEACVTYQSVYLRLLRGDTPLLEWSISNLTRLGRNTILVGIGYVPFLFWGPALRERRMLYLAYLGSLYAVSVQGTFAGYHYLPGLAIGAILLGSIFSLSAGIFFRDHPIEIGKLRLSLNQTLATALIILMLPVYLDFPRFDKVIRLHFLKPPEQNEFRNDTVFDFTESWDVAAYIHARTQPLDRIQVWGNESLVYYLADRFAASRFQMSNPLVTRVPGYGLGTMQERWRQEFMRDMVKLPPRYIAIVTQDKWWWAPEERTSEQLLDDFPEWKQFIRENYSLDRTIGRFEIYSRLTPL